MSAELVKELEAELEQEVEQHNELAKNIEAANQELYSRRGRIGKLQELIQRYTESVAVDQNGHRPDATEEELAQVVEAAGAAPEAVPAEADGAPEDPQ